MAEAIALHQPHTFVPSSSHTSARPLNRNSTSFPPSELSGRASSFSSPSSSSSSFSRHDKAFCCRHRCSENDRLGRRGKDASCVRIIFSSFSGLRKTKNSTFDKPGEFREILDRNLPKPGNIFKLRDCERSSPLRASALFENVALHEKAVRLGKTSSRTEIETTYAGGESRPRGWIKVGGNGRSRTTKTSTAATTSAAAGNRSQAPGGDQMLVYVPPHPLIKHWIAVLRHDATPPAIFRNALAELGRLLIYEASRDWLPLVDAEVQTPCGIADVSFLDPTQPIKIVPILRAGSVMLESAGTLLPASETYHLGYSRDETTLQLTPYYNNLPKTFPEGARVLLVDPMMGTGGTITAAIEEITSRGADTRRMRIVSAVCCPTALQKLAKYSGLRIYTGIIDPELNESGMIVPGLGDAADRSFGTGAKSLF